MLASFRANVASLTWRFFCRFPFSQLARRCGTANDVWCCNKQSSQIKFVSFCFSFINNHRNMFFWLQPYTRTLFSCLRFSASCSLVVSLVFFFGICLPIVAGCHQHNKHEPAARAERMRKWAEDIRMFKERRKETVKLLHFKSSKFMKNVCTVLSIMCACLANLVPLPLPLPPACDELMTALRLMLYPHTGDEGKKIYRLK